MRLLIVKLGSIGDIVHTLPALAAVRQGFPDSEISWVVERNLSEILRDNPILDRLIEGGTKALRRGLMSGETLRAPRQQLRWYVPRPSTSFLSFSHPLNRLSDLEVLLPDAFKSGDVPVCAVRLSPVNGKMS